MQLIGMDNCDFGIGLQGFKLNYNHPITNSLKQLLIFEV